MTKRYPAFLMTCLVATLASPVLAQKVGPEFQVNTSTTGYPRRPDVASDSAGNFMVVWNTGYYGHGMFARNYDSDGKPLGDQFQIAEDGYPAVAATNGNFIVVWWDGDDNILGKRYDGHGEPLGDEFPIAPGRGTPDVASDASGNFVVVWAYDGRRFDGDGNPLGDEFPVSGAESVASNADGNFVVVWTGYRYGYDALGQRYDHTGTPVGGEFQVNTYTTGYQTGPSVATTVDGNFVVVWASGYFFSPGPDGDQSGVSGQLYDKRGKRIGGEFQVNTYTTGCQWRPSVAADRDGNFTVIWQSGGSRFCGGQDGVYGRRYDAQGRPLTDEFRVNAYDSAAIPSVSSASSGRFVVVWESYLGYGFHESGIFGQRFATGCRSTVSDPSSVCPEKR